MYKLKEKKEKNLRFKHPSQETRKRLNKKVRILKIRAEINEIQNKYQREYVPI